MTGTFGDGGLTEVERHADEDNQAEPGVEVGDKVDNWNDDVSDGWEDAEHNVTAGGGRIKGEFGPIHLSRNFWFSSEEILHSEVETSAWFGL